MTTIYAFWSEWHNRGDLSLHGRIGSFKIDKQEQGRYPHGCFPVFILENWQDMTGHMALSPRRGLSAAFQERPLRVLGAPDKTGSMIEVDSNPW